MVEAGKFPSVSAVVQHAVEIVREKTEQEAMDRQAFLRWIEGRMTGPTLSLDEFRVRMETMIQDRKAKLLAEFADHDVED